MSLARCRPLAWNTFRWGADEAHRPPGVAREPAGAQQPAREYGRIILAAGQRVLFPKDIRGAPRLRRVFASLPGQKQLQGSPVCRLRLGRLPNGFVRIS